MRPIQIMRLRNASGGGGGSDPFFANVVSGLHFDGVNGGTSFPDIKGKTWTLSGTVTTSTARSVYGGASALFSGGRLDCTGGTDFAFGTGDFTLEFWLYGTQFGSATGPTILDNRIGGGVSMVLYQPNSTSNLVAFLNGADRITATGVSNGAFNHIALCRGSGTTRLFVGGVSAGTFADANSYGNGASSTFRLGQNNINSSALAGNIDDLRVTNGVARYTSNFTPPPSPFPDS